MSCVTSVSSSVCVRLLSVVFVVVVLTAGGLLGARLTRVVSAAPTPVKRVPVVDSSLEVTAEIPFTAGENTTHTNNVALKVRLVEARLWKAEELSVGDRLRLHCRASGRPSPVVTWYKDGQLVDSSLHGSRSLATGSGGFRVRTTRRVSTLRKSAQLSDSGVYFCVANNGDGEARSATVHVIVRTVDELRPTLAHMTLCDEKEQSYCFNGVCHKTQSDRVKGPLAMFCRCDDGFQGVRCGEKTSSVHVVSLDDVQSTVDGIPLVR